MVSLDGKCGGDRLIGRAERVYKDHTYDHVQMCSMAVIYVMCVDRVIYCYWIHIQFVGTDSVIDCSKVLESYTSLQLH